MDPATSEAIEEHKKAIEEHKKAIAEQQKAIAEQQKAIEKLKNENKARIKEANAKKQEAEKQDAKTRNERKKNEDEEREAARKKVLVPIANGTDAVEAVVTIDVLRRAYAKVTVASVENELQVEASKGVKIVADALISECAETVFDLIALPGGDGAETLRDCKTLENMVKMQAAKNQLCAAISTAPAIAFGPWGLLKGKKATCHPSSMMKLPSTATPTESRVEKDGNVVTSRGTGTAIEYAIELVNKLYGEEKATEVSQELIVRSNHGEEYAFANLNPVRWTFDGSPKILVPIANGTEEVEVVIMVDVLRKAGAKVVVAFVEDKKEAWEEAKVAVEGKKEIVTSRDVKHKKEVRAGAKVVKDEKEIVAFWKVKLVADMLLDEAVGESYDLIVLPGELGGARAFHYSKKLIDLLKKQNEADKPFGAICASPSLVLRYHGLLEGKKATAHPLVHCILKDPSEAANRVVVDGNVATSQAPGTAMEYALVLVEKLFGKERATELATDIVFV